MRRFAVAWATAVGLLAAGFFLSAGSSRADIDKKEMNSTLAKIAKALESGDDATATKLAEDLAKKVEDLDDLMHSFKPRNKKGLGVGSKEGVVQPDGIEQKLNSISRDGITPGQLKKEAENLTEAAWMTAAIAKVTVYKAPAKDKGKKTKANWSKYSKGTIAGAQEMAKASKDMDVNAVKTAAVKVNNNCNSCHMYFRD